MVASVVTTASCSSGWDDAELGLGAAACKGPGEERVAGTCVGGDVDDHLEGRLLLGAELTAERLAAQGIVPLRVDGPQRFLARPEEVQADGVVGAGPQRHDPGGPAQWVLVTQGDLEAQVGACPCGLGDVEAEVQGVWPADQSPVGWGCRL